MKKTFSVYWWTLAFIYKHAKIETIFTFITHTISVVTPIFTIYIGSLIINKMVNESISPEDVIPEFLALLTLMFFGIVLRDFDLKYFIETRFNYKWDLNAWKAYLIQKSQIDFEYIESKEFNLTEKKGKSLLHWRAGIILRRSADIMASLISILLIGSLIAVLEPIFLLLLVISVILNFVVSRNFGFAIYNFWDTDGEEKIHSDNAMNVFNSQDVISESKVYRFTDKIIHVFSDAQSRFIDFASKKANKTYFYSFLIKLFDVFIFIGFQIYLITQFLEGSIDIGQYSFYFGNIFIISGALIQAEGSFSAIINQLQYADDLKKFFELPKKIQEINNPIGLEPTPPSIEFKDVSFNYPGIDKSVFQELSFSIKPGEKVALIGKNGAGKTTLIKLLARFYDISKGEILVNGYNIKHIDLNSYYDLWGILFQSFAKFWFSVKDNISIGDLKQEDNIKLLKESMEKSDVNSFVNELPEKYDTLLSRDFDKGVDLSGGQWQKIGIARALFANPKLIILDEPTSALDALSEAKVFEELTKVAKDSTVIIVSHRFATVRNADKIIVLDKGKILEQGTHEELLKNKSLYFEMFTAQAEGYQ